MKESKDKQINFRVEKTVSDLFDAAADKRGITRTEALTRLMIVYGQDQINAATHHLDGEACPLSLLLDGIQQAVAARLR